MAGVKPKKRFGQHFLKDALIAGEIVASLSGYDDYQTVVEVGPGTGILTDLLWQLPQYTVYLIEIDRESVAYLKKKYPQRTGQVISGDILSWDPQTVTQEPFALIGNFPYNISSQILFKVLDHKDQIPEVVGMFQKEVAQRIASGPNNKIYGIISVLVQAYYQTEYLFTVGPDAFQPAPKVESAVIRLQRLKKKPGCDEQLFRRIVKQGFQNRRKTLRNALKPFNLPDHLKQLPELDQRAEQLSVTDFVLLTNKLAEHWKK